MKTKAPKKGKKPKHPVVKQTIQYPYKFTEAEIAAMSCEMRTHLREIDDLEDQKKQSNADFKLRIDTHDNNVKRLRAKCDSGEETRPLEAIVEFNTPKAGRKTYIHPETGERIRDEEMTISDSQLPMFRPTTDGKEVVAKRGETDVPVVKPAQPVPPKTTARKPTADEKAGKTNVGDAIGAVAALKDAPKLKISLTLDWMKPALLREFKKVAKDAKWDATQIALMDDVLKACADVEAMKETLRPHSETAAN